MLTKLYTTTRRPSFWGNTELDSLFDLSDTLFDSFHKSLNKITHPYDLYETADKQILEIPLAGFKKDQIKVELSENNTLSVIAEKEKDETPKEYIIKKVKSDKIELYFSVLTSVDADHISTSFTDGLLVITLPKKKKNAKSLTID